MKRWLPFALVAAISTACDELPIRQRAEIVQESRSGAGGDYRDVTDFPVNDGQWLAAALPEEFALNTAASVTVYTEGSGCDEVAPTELTVTDLLATIEPYIWKTGRNCPDIGRIFVHTADVTFPEVGAAILRFIGWDGNDSLVTVELAVSVTP